MATDAREREGAGPRHRDARWSFRDRLLHGARRPVREISLYGWTWLVVSEISFVGLAVQDLPHALFAAIGWAALAMSQAGLSIWYVCRRVEK